MSLVSPTRERARRIAQVAKVVLFNVLSVTIGFLLLIHIPFAASFTTLRKEAMLTTEGDIMRFQPNLRDAPYLHTTLRGTYKKYQDILISTNAEGFRDKDHAVEKPPNSIRIATLGDSFIFGLGLTQEETLAAQLEKELNAGGGNPKVETMNFGLPGLTLEGMARVNETFAKKYRPDIVLYSFMCDDLTHTDSITHRQWIHVAEHYLGRVPRWLEPYFEAMKMLRNNADWRMAASIPPLYRKRLRVVLDYLYELGTTGNNEVVIVDYCRNGQINRVFDDMAAAGKDRIHLVTDFPFEVNPDNDHPTGPSNAGLAKRLAPLMRKIAEGRTNRARDLAEVPGGR